MNERDEPVSGLEGLGPDPLPMELIAAVQRARARTAAPDRVAATTAAILNATKRSDRPANIFFQGRKWLVAAAIAASFLWCFAPQPEQPRPHTASERHVSSSGVDRSEPAGDGNVYSRITKISLVQVGYGRIETDLDRAEAELAKVSEGVALAAVRHDIQAALEDFYDWRETR